MAPVVRSRQSRGRDRCSQLDTTLIGGAVAYCQRQREALAEGVGFEPTGHPRRPTVFKTAAFNRSATPPIHMITAGVRPLAVDQLMAPSCRFSYGTSTAAPRTSPLR